jgi:glycolate oxidase iron-sulfur subunit
MTTCPSGVHYQHLIDHARVHVERTYRRPIGDRLLRSLLAALLPYPRRFAAALAAARLARPLAPLLPKRIRASLDLAVRRPAAAAASRHAAAAAAAPRARVAVLTGCVQRVLAPEINAATIRVLERAGAEVTQIDGCCGAIVHHLGRAADNRAHAAGLIERVHRALTARGVDAVVATASGCGTHVKDYGFVFRADTALAEQAAAVASVARDVTEVLAQLGLPPVVNRAGLKIAYHSACSMQHGQRVERAPRELLVAAGFEVFELGEPHLCCGSAGTYNVLQPEIAGRLRDRKLGHIAARRVDAVATGNIGCMQQLRVPGGTPILHTVELLDFATGGPVPAALAELNLGARVETSPGS